MNGVIVFKSKYGSTKQNAEWIKEETNFDLFPVSHCPKELSRYDVIVVGSSIHAGSLSLKNFLIHNWPSISTKTVALMLTSGTSDKRFLNKTLERSLPSHILNGISVFPVGGRYIFEKMSIIDRNLIKVAAFFTKHPESKKGMLTERDDVNKTNLKELLEFIKSKSRK